MGVTAFAGCTLSGEPSSACLCSLHRPKNQAETRLLHSYTGRVFQAFLTNVTYCPTLGQMSPSPLPYDLPWDVTAIIQGSLRLILLDLVPEQNQEFASEHHSK